MARTSPMHQRIGQRDVTSRDQSRRYGKRQSHCWDRKNVEELLVDLETFRKDLLNLHEKGGLVVIESGETQITVYRTDSFNQKKKVTYARH